MNFEEKIKQLTEPELRLLAGLHSLGGGDFGYGNCYWPNMEIRDSGPGDWHVSDYIHSPKDLSKALKKLRDLDLVNYQRGLMTEDGDVAGSGNAPNYIYEKDIAKLFEDREWL